VLAAEGDAGAGQVNGQLVDRPVFDRARNILREAGN
jgi:citrate lyase beta subunit